MSHLRLLLLVFFAMITAYTLITVLNHGWNLVPVFLGDLTSLSWRGQFNLDFSTYLLLSALWVAWRGGFTAGSIALGAAALGLGMLILSAYLLMLTSRPGTTMRTLLLGVHDRAHVPDGAVV